MSPEEEGLKQIAKAARQAKEDAFARHATSFETGIDFLDDAMGGIYRDDVVLLGAATGKGKTQLASIMAVNAARVGKRVIFFALEAAPNEIERRMISMEMNLNEADGFRYRRGIMSSEILAKEEMAVAKIEKEELQIYVKYKKGDFGAEELTRSLVSMAGFADLFIIDHFHFIDHEQSRSEQEGHKKTIKTIRDLALVAGKPILLIAHMNKAYGKNQSEVPTIYDFYGTADLGNVCTKAITISTVMPEWMEFHHAAGQVPTLFHVAKNREESSTNRYVAICIFDVANNKYEPGYFLFDMYKKERLTRGNAPAWATNIRADRPYTAKL